MKTKNDLVMPTDECIEQWWAGKSYKNKMFWQEAPYMTNGDVVEEIKSAVKYFITKWQQTDFTSQDVLDEMEVRSIGEEIANG